jgi:LmbE family N-acetylglucosaminyl deacetylase
MEEQIDNWNDEDRKKILSLVKEKRERHHRVHGRLPTTGEEFRFHEEAVREISFQRKQNLEQAAAAYKKRKTRLE